MKYYLCKEEGTVYTEDELIAIKYEEWRSGELSQGNKNRTFEDFIKACKRYDTLTEINPLDCSIEVFETEEIITDLAEAIAKYRTVNIRYLTQAQAKDNNTDNANYRTIYFFVID